MNTRLVNPKSIHKYSLLISYDGTCFGGWQSQPNTTSIQSLIEKALTTALHLESIDIIGSGRTDAGVHALGQVAHFIAPLKVDKRKLIHSLNGLLPKEIRILKIQEENSDFHARYSARTKTYRYQLNTAHVNLPFQRLYSYHIPWPVDFDLLKEAGHIFIGTHDFTSFANESHYGPAAKNPLRTIHKLSIVQEDSIIQIEVQGDGFLYKMVRNIVGTMLEVARKKLPIGRLVHILESKDRRAAGPAAPAHGLFLICVDYTPST